MPDLMPLALEFARAFNKAVRSFRMYSPTHPQVAHDLADAFSWLEKMTSQESPVSLGTRDGSMIVQSRPVREMTAILKAFCDALSTRGISSFSVQRGANLQEFSAFVDILVKKPEDCLQGESIKPELLKPLHRIRINELRFVALDEGTNEEAVKALSAAGEGQGDMAALLAAVARAGPGEAGALSQRLVSLVQKGDANDIVKMIDDVQGALDKSGLDPAARADRMSQLFRSLPIKEEAPKQRRVLVMQEDPPVRAEWLAALRQQGFEAEAADSPPQALQLLRNGKHWSGLVADAGFRGADGVNFLDDVAKSGKKPVPVVLCSWDESVREAAPVANYPRLKFFAQPVAPPSITEVVDEIALPPEKERLSASQIQADPMLAKELDRAREIQAKLLPKEWPAVPGFEIAAWYTPATHVGGDYYDVLQLPGGRIGFVVADVSGKGISAAMIMVMARTIFHTVAPGAASAREAVLAANARLVPDLPPGLFLTLAYAILDPEKGTVSVVSCGHNPPLLWTRWENMAVVQTIDVHGAAMGLVRGPAFERSISECVVNLQPGEHFLIHTDGVNEAMNPANEEFGDMSLFRAMRRGGERNAEGMAQGIVNAVEHHRSGAPPSDDLTVVVVRRTP